MKPSPKSRNRMNACYRLNLCRLHVESLEHRLPPGDAIGGMLASYIVGSSIGLLEQSPGTSNLGGADTAPPYQCNRDPWRSSEEKDQKGDSRATMPAAVTVSALQESSAGAMRATDVDRSPVAVNAVHSPWLEDLDGLSLFPQRRKVKAGSLLANVDRERDAAGSRYEVSSNSVTNPGNSLGVVVVGFESASPAAPSKGFTLNGYPTAARSGLGGGAPVNDSLGDEDFVNREPDGRTSPRLVNFTNYKLNGDYVAAGVGLRGQTSGNITIAGIPSGATVKAAHLFWGFLDNGESGSLKSITFSGTGFTGIKTGTNEDTCWDRTNSHGYRADVTSKVTGNGAYALTGVASGGDILAQGASLVVVYEMEDLPTSEIFLYAGNDVVNEAGETATNNFSGLSRQGTTAKTTFIVGDGQAFNDAGGFSGSNGSVNLTDTFQGSDGQLWDTDTYDASGVLSPTDTSMSAFIKTANSNGDCLMWVSQVVAKSKLDIDADIDRDGTVKNTDQDEKGEETVGTLVIRDKDNVYADADEPAQRREIVLRKGGTEKLRVKRSSANLKLFTAKTGGTELFGDQDEVALAPNTYWLQGGANASAKVRDESLKVRLDKDGAAYEDQINITVLWVDISGHNSGTMSKKPVYDGSDRASGIWGHDKLGVQRGNASSPDTDRRVRGIIEVQGKISPNDLAFDKKITSGFKDGDDTNNKNTPAQADFGFIFRRVEDVRVYANGQDTVIQREDGNDDSLRAFQDVDPDKDGDKLLIVDVDGPSATATTTSYFKHSRMNFTEHLVFNFYAKTPERTSEKLKWAFSGDVALSYDNKAVFIRDEANDGDNINEVKVGAHLPDLKLFADGDQKARLTSAETTAGDKKIKQNTDVTVVVKGSGLVGEIFLVKGATQIKAKLVQVKETDAAKQFSDLTEVRATFNTSEAPAQGFHLEVRNALGTSNPIAGFEVVPCCSTNCALTDRGTGFSPVRTGAGPTLQSTGEEPLGVIKPKERSCFFSECPS